MDATVRTVMLGLDYIIKKSDNKETEDAGIKMLDVLFRKFPDILPQPGNKRI